jgi:hypothetical protein
MTTDDDKPFYAAEPGPVPDLTIVPGGGTEPIPKPPRGLGPHGREAWGRLWRTGRAWLSNSAHIDAMTVLVDALDDRERLRADLRKADTIVRGSRHNDVVSPLYKAIDNCDAKVLDGLRRLGFEPPPQRRRVGQRRQSRLDQLRARKAMELSDDRNQ